MLDTCCQCQCVRWGSNPHILSGTTDLKLAVFASFATDAFYPVSQ